VAREWREEGMTRKSDQMPEKSEERKMQDLLAKMRKLRPELT
jgi:hypothetical protein